MKTTDTERLDWLEKALLDDEEFALLIFLKGSAPNSEQGETLRQYIDRCMDDDQARKNSTEENWNKIKWDKFPQKEGEQNGRESP